MIKVPYEIKLTGDKDYGRDFIGAGQSQMRILESELSFQDLEQGVRRIQLNPRITVKCSINNGIKVIEIYCIPIEKEEKEEEEEKGFIYRFFAKVRRGGLQGEIKYYWIQIKKRNGQFRIKVVLVFPEDKNVNGMSIETTLWAFSNLPLNMIHAATKSFMLDKSAEGDEPKFERWVATQHALAIDRTIVFYPVYFAFSGTDYVYPYPPALGGDGFGGFTHPVPPNRFYCNVEKGIMAWYSVKTIPNPIDPVLPPISYVFGLLLRISKGQLVAIKIFNCYSSEVDAEGFDPLWFYKGTVGTPLPLYAEVPTEMMADINCIGDEELEVIIPWNYRPIKYKVDLTGPTYATVESDHTYEAVKSCDHWHWAADGFEQVLSGEFEQTDKSITVEHNVNSGVGPGSTCGGNTEEECCTGCGDTGFGNVNNKTWSQEQSILHQGSDLESSCNIKIFDETESMHSAMVYERYIHEFRRYTMEYCRFDPYASPKCVHVSAGDVDWRYIKEEMKIKVVDSVEAEWSSPNVAFVGSSIDRKYGKNMAFQVPGGSGHWGVSCANAPECLDLCYRTGPHIPGCPQEACCGGALCFYGYPFPNNDWPDSPGTVVDSFQQMSNGCKWTRTQDANGYSNPLVLQYRIGGEGYFSSQLFNRTYYLDDRSTDDNEGLLVAARGAIIADYTVEGYPIFEVARWGVVYKVNDENFTEITDKLLEALGCDETELIELGLI